jgi:SET domain-containing protein
VTQRPDFCIDTTILSRVISSLLSTSKCLNNAQSRDSFKARFLTDRVAARNSL